MTKFFYLLFSCMLIFKISNAQVAVTADESAKAYTPNSDSQVTPTIITEVVAKNNSSNKPDAGKIPDWNSRQGTPTTSLAQCSSYAITGFATSGAFRAPNARFMSGRLAYIVTASEMVAASVANGQQITGIGWLNTIAPGVVANGNLKLYLENTNDLVYTKSTDWATAIGTMTTVHDGAFTIPNALEYNLNSFTGGTPFTYTGGAVYVAFEWTYCSGTLSTTQSVGCNNTLVGGANGSSSLQSLVSCTPSTTLVSSAFRPITRFFFDCHDNDIKVNTMYSMGKLALGHSTNHAVSAYVSNNGVATVNNIPVTLTVSGVNTVNNTQTIPTLAPGQATMVTFPGYTPASTGNNTVTVSVPADDVNSNNSQAITQVVSLEEIGIKAATDVANLGAGFAGTTGIIASRFNTTTGGILKSVRLSFNTANGSTYRIAIYGDNNGVPSNTALYTDAADRTVTAIGDAVLTLNSPVNIPAGNFYVAIQQLSTTNMQLRFTFEDPLRAGQIFVNSVDLSSGWSDNSPALTFRYNVDAQFYAYTITASAGTGGAISPAGITGVDNNGTQAYTITPDPCFIITDVLVDGVSVGPVNTYTFSNVTANHTISVSFAGGAGSVPAPVVNGFTNVCSFLGNGTQVIYTANSAGATSYAWSVPPNVNIISGQGTANLTVTFNSNFNLQANKQIRVIASSPCGTSPQTIYYLLTQSVSTPGAIVASSTDICPVIGTNTAITYTIRKVQGATSYIWQTQVGTTDTTHPNGQGANDTTITVKFNSGFTTSYITVQAVNGCGTSGTRSFLVTRNVISTGMISGPVNACEFSGPNGTPATYTVPFNPDVTYTWILPAGSTSIVGQGTNSISFVYPSGYTGGSISVSSTNGCGMGPVRTLNITSLNPSTPGAITAVNTVSCAEPGPDRVYTYTLSPILPSHATSIVWTIPSSGVLVNGQGTTNITVSYPATAVVGTVTAQSINNCGVSGIRTIPVNLDACPPEFAAGREMPGTLTNEVASLFDVQAYPNPAIGELKLKMNTTDRNNMLAVRVLDVQGRELIRMKLAPASQILLGNDLKAGVYLIEVTQGTNKKVLSVVKL